MQIEFEIKKNEKEEGEGQVGSQNDGKASQANEYKLHPLYQQLQVYSRELKDYILEKRALRDQRQSQLIQY